MGKETNQKCEIRNKKSSKISKNILKRQTKIKKILRDRIKKSRTKKQNNLGDQSQGKKLSLKLLIDSKANKVLFAEVGKDFVDFLIHIMSLPIGMIIRLLNVKGMVGCLGTLYKSMETLSTDYFQPNLKKDTILNPTGTVNNVPLLSLNDGAAPTDNKVSLYRCDYYGRDRCDRYTDCLGTVCPRCDLEMSTLLSYVEPTTGLKKCCSTGSDGGYVKGLVTYMVMDDLEVKPMSTISGITLMNKFCVTDLSDLVEKEVQLGIKEGVAILKASMETSAVLTNVFIA